MVNKCILIGNLGRDPETKELKSGGSLTSFSLATNERFLQNNEWREKTEWHTCDCWGKMSERSQKLKKGDTVFIEGKVTYSEYEKDGQKHRRAAINVLSFKKLNKSDDMAF